MTEFRDSAGRLIRNGDWIFWDSYLGQVVSFFSGSVHVRVYTRSGKLYDALGYWPATACIKIPFDKEDFRLYNLRE